MSNFLFFNFFFFQIYNPNLQKTEFRVITQKTKSFTMINDEYTKQSYSDKNFK